jgi:hypothetical protein
MLIRLSGCEDGNTCPAVYAEDTETAVVRGYVVSDGPTLASLELPEGEAAVRLPLSRLREALEQWEQQS